MSVSVRSSIRAQEALFSDGDGEVEHVAPAPPTEIGWQQESGAERREVEAVETEAAVTETAETEAVESVEDASDPYVQQEAAYAQDGPPYGFYPTGEEVDLLGGESHDMYRRGRGGINMNGPDAWSLTASGMWHQDEPVDSFYDRYDGFFEPLDSTLGLFAPRELALFESADEPSNGNFSAYSDLGFPLTRNFNPDLATFKAGPLYLDLISISGTVLYSDYEGDGRASESDGWLSAVQLNLRGLVQITENLYLTGSGQVYYLPGSGEVGFYFGDGAGSFLRLAYETYYKGWEITIFDEFRAIHRLSDIFDSVEHNEIEIAGRYRFGRFDEAYNNDPFSTDSIFLINRAGIAVNKDLNDWSRFSAGYTHFDHWQTFEFDEHRQWDQIYARLDYAGQDWRIAPFLEYRMTAVDGYENLFHAIYLGARAAISENVRAQGRVGYFHTDRTDGADADRFLGDLSIEQQLTESTRHSLSGGITHNIWYDADNWLSTYGRYAIDQRLGSRLTLNAYAQYSDSENLDVIGRDREGWMTGAALTAAICDYTSLRFDVAYDDWTSAKGGPAEVDYNRWIYRASVNQRLMPYLYARLLYQYEDFSRADSFGFDEHLYMLTITHIF